MHDGACRSLMQECRQLSQKKEGPPSHEQSATDYRRWPAGDTTYRTPIGLGQFDPHTRGTAHHEGQVLRFGINALLLASRDG